MSERLDIIPLGGLGEFGMNMMLYRDGRDALVIDCGMMFPTDAHLGVDRVIPDFSFLGSCGTLHGVVATHGHEDHIGAIPHLLARHDVPVFAPPHAKALIQAKLAEYSGLKDVDLATLPPDGEALTLGPFRVTALPATHSIPQSKMIAIETRHGIVLHTADFKLDGAGSGEEATDLEAVEALGERGVLALCCDSTNADRPGATPGEAPVTAALAQELDRTRGRMFVTTFASNVRRVETLARLARERDRHLVLVGSSLQNQVGLAERLGIVRFAPGTRITTERAMTLPANKLVIVATGSQGEPQSAMARIAMGTHRDVGVTPGDRVIHSARVIPGNERRIGRMLDLLLRQGAEVVTARDALVHVSGHPSQDDLAELMGRARPRYLVPMHGEYRQQWALRQLALERGMAPEDVVLAESGDLIGLSSAGIGIRGRVPSGAIQLDDQGLPVDPEVVADRRRLAGSGVVIPVLRLDRARWLLVHPPEMLTEGFSSSENGAFGGILQDAGTRVAQSVRDATPEERNDQDMLKTRIRSDLRRFLRRRVRRQPLIAPVIVEC